MTEHCAFDTSGMVACKLNPPKADALIAGDTHLSSLSVGCRNSEDACVISGILTQLDAFQETCSSLGTKTKRLAVPYGFHSEAMDPIVNQLTELGESVVWSTPSIPVGSNALGRFLVPEDFGPGYFAMHARQPVRFADIVLDLQNLGALNNAVCIEVGPNPTTLPMMQNIANSTCHFFPSMQKDKDSWILLHAILGWFFNNQDVVDWRRAFEPDMQVLDLPGHPLVNTPFPMPYREPNQVTMNSGQIDPSYTSTGFTLLPRRMMTDSTPAGISGIFETTMAILGPHIAGHNVGGTAICPASVFFELALEAAHAINPNRPDDLFIGQDISFSNPLIYDSNQNSQIIRVSLIQQIARLGSITGFKVTISAVQGGKEIPCCITNISVKRSSELRRSLLKDAALATRQQRHFSAGSIAHNNFHRKLLYETIFTRVVAYSAEYQSLTSFSLSDSNDEGFGLFTLPSTSSTTGCLIPPVFTDTLLHAAGFAANLSVPSDDICICGYVGSVEVLDGINFNSEFTVYCTLFDNSNGAIIADAVALGSNGEACAAVRGIEFKKLRLTSFQRLLQNAATRTAQVTPSPDTVSYPSLQIGRKLVNQVSASNVPQALGVDTRTRIRDSVSNIVGEIYGSGAIDPMQSLEALGIDSLMQIEITSKLREFFPGTDMNPNDLLQCESLEALENFVVSAIVTPDLILSGSVTPELNSSIPTLSDRTSTGVRDTMVGVINEVYGSQDLDYSKSLDSLGIDSLMQIEIATKLKDAFPGTDFDHHDLTQHETLGAVEELLEYKILLNRNRSDTREIPTPTTRSSTDTEITSTGISETFVRASKAEPSLLHTSDNAHVPVYLIHDGSGQIGMYTRLCKLDRNVLGFFDPDYPREPLQVTSLEQMAARYTSSIVTSGVHDLIIGGESLVCQIVVWSLSGTGWSFGGVIAFQAAQYLSRAGFRLKGVILIDSPYPRNHEPLPERVIEHVLSTSSANRKAGMANVITEFKQNADLLADYHPQDHNASKDFKIRTVYLRSQETLDTEGTCGVAYDWLSSQDARDAAIHGWEKLVGGRMQVLPLCGNHFEPFLPPNACCFIPRNTI